MENEGSKEEEEEVGVRPEATIAPTPITLKVENMEFLDADSSLKETTQLASEEKKPEEEPEETIVFSSAEPLPSPSEDNYYETVEVALNEKDNDDDGKESVSLSHVIEPSPSYVSSVSSTTGITSPFTPNSTSQSQSLTHTSPPQTNTSQHSFSSPKPTNSINNNQNHSIINSSSMTTIENSSPQQHNTPSITILRKDSDEVMNIPPVHPFFHQHGMVGDDSDGSDASFVHKGGRSSVGSTSSRSQARDRFPSYDSTTSTGSIKYVPKTNSHHSWYPSAQGQPTEQLQSHLLPYHERRKRMLQREQQLNSHNPMHPVAAAKPPPGVTDAGGSTFPPLSPHAILAASGGLPPGMDPRVLMGGYLPQHPSQSQSQGQPPAPETGPQYPPPIDPMAAAAFFNLYGMPPPGYPYPGFPPPNYSYHPYAYAPPPSNGAPRQAPSSSAPTPPPAHLYAVHPPPAQAPSSRTPTGSSHHGASLYAYPPSYGMPPAASTHPSHHSHPHQQQPIQPLPGPPSAFPQSTSAASTGSASSSIRPRLSPYRSLPKPSVQERRPPTGKPHLPAGGRAPRGAKPQPQQKWASDASSGDSRPPPPPPPGAPAASPGSNHAREDSFGSISSIGSGQQDDPDPPTTPKEYSNKKPSPAHRRNTSGSSGSFLDLLRQQWTPPSDGPASSVSDFHRRNQQFLHKVTHVRTASNSPQQAMHKRVSSQDRPPPSRGTHRRLNSINNDDWEENDDETKEPTEKPGAAESSGGDFSLSSGGRDFSLSSGGYSHSSSSDTDHKPLQQKQPAHRYPQAAHRHRDAGAARVQEPPYRRHDTQAYRDRRGQDFYFNQDDSTTANETTSLLPPSGISTNERDGSRRHHPDPSEEWIPMDAANEPTERWDNRAFHQESSRPNRKSRKKKHKRRQKVARNYQGEYQSSDSSHSNQDYRQWTRKRARMLEKERAKLIAQWKAEAKAEAEMSEREAQANQWHHQAGRALQNEWHRFSSKFLRCMVGVETLIANIPLTIGAVAMAVVTLGVVWFKFAEENLESCEPVHFHSSQCTFPEFPGCFYCDTDAKLYRLALGFHYGCKFSAGILSMFFILKVLLATRVVVDEMSSPTTASPAGLLCMTLVCVFAGRGLMGQFMVTSAAFVHFGLVVWFIYMALAYHIMPEPSWFPNTVGVGLTAVKTWLYYPTAGHLLMLISLVSNFFFFPISLIRVAINKKISATVGWMQMSAPAISLYALTIMAQPSFAEEHPDVTKFQRVHRIIYLPCMHFMAALSVLGFLASCHSLWKRWHVFKKREFSPAHAAFCFPVLSYANALQAYRGALLSFSDIHPRSWRMVTLYIYWFTILTGGTIVTIWITAKFLYSLPKWTYLDILDEEEPPAPNETIIALQDMVTAGETMRQHFVSPAVLQANETGALVLARSGPEGELRYVRTRRLPALGFEPTMDWSEMQQEREVLLEWAAQNPPRRRHRTLSVPGIDFSYGAGFGTGNSGVYGAVGWSPRYSRRRADSSFH